MAKNKKPGAIQKSFGWPEDGLQRLEDIEKDLSTVRENLQKFFDRGEEVLGGPIFKLPRPRPPRRAKIPRR